MCSLCQYLSNRTIDFKHVTLTVNLTYFCKAKTLHPQTYTMPCGALPDFVSILVIPSQQCWRGYSHAAVGVWLGEWVDGCVRLSVCPSVRPLRFTLWTQYRVQLLPDHFQTSHVSCWLWEEESYWFLVTVSKVKVNSRIQTKVLAQSLSNFSCMLWMMRGGSLLILAHGVKSQGQIWHLWVQYKWVWVQTWWWQEEPYWFWVMGSKVKVNFAQLWGIATLCVV